VSYDTLMAQPFYAARLETAGEAVPLAEGIATYTSPSRSAAFTISPQGLLVYQAGTDAGLGQITWKDRAGKQLGTLGDPASGIGDIHLSPDGKSLVAGIDPRQRDLWIFDVARGLRTRFTFDPASDQEPTWTADGSTVIWRRGGRTLLRKAANGTGAEEVLVSDRPTNKMPTSVSPDGKWLLYSDSVDIQDIMILSLAADPTGKPAAPRPFLQTPFNESFAEFSPEGNWVVYVSNESGRSEIYALPFSGKGGKRQISSGGGSYPHWRRDGKEIFYVTQNGDLMAADVSLRNEVLEVGRVRKLFGGVVTGRGYTYDVTADGQRFIVVEDQGAKEVPPLTLLQNWTAALKK
jgi:Tol biopolymer transport system component